MLPMAFAPTVSKSRLCSLKLLLSSVRKSHLMAFYPGVFSNSCPLFALAAFDGSLLNFDWLKRLLDEPNFEQK